MKTIRELAQRQSDTLETIRRYAKGDLVVLGPLGDPLTSPLERAALLEVSALNERLLEEYANRGDVRGAISPEWEYSQGEWSNLDQKPWVNLRDHEGGDASWEYGVSDERALGEEDPARWAMRAAGAWRAAHPLGAVPVISQLLLPAEIEALRDILRDWNRLAQSKSAQMAFNAVHKNLHDCLLDAHDFTTEQADDLLKKLGIE